MKAARLQRFYWLNIKALGNCLTKPSQELIEAKYFTSRISGALPSDPPNVALYKNAKLRRQTTFLEALSTIDGLPGSVRYSDSDFWRQRSGASGDDGAPAFSEQKGDRGVSAKTVFDATEPRSNGVLQDLRQWSQKQSIAEFRPAS